MFCEKNATKPKQNKLQLPSSPAKTHHHHLYFSAMELLGNLKMRLTKIKRVNFCLEVTSDSEGMNHCSSIPEKFLEDIVLA